MESAPPARPFLVVALVLAAGDALGVAARATDGLSAAVSRDGALLAATVVAVLGVSATARWRPRSARRAAGLAVLAIAFGRALASAGPADAGALRSVSGPGLGGVLAEAEAQPALVLPEGVARADDRVRAVGAPRAWRRARAPGDAPRVQRLELELEDVDRHPRAAPVAPWIAGGLARVREGSRERLADLGDAETRGLALALVLGDRGSLPAGLPDLFTRTGTRHLLALSGLHVGLFAWLVVRRVARLAGSAAGRGRVAAEALVGASLLIALAPLAGAGAPVRRACWAGALAYLAPLVPSAVPGAGRRVDALSLWSFALVLELLAAPGASARVGVRLSYAATLGLLVVLPSVLRRNATRGPAVDRLGRPRAGSVACAARRLAGGFRTALAASVVAVLATLPVSWSTFGELSLLGPLVTPLCIPPLVVLVAAGLAWTLAPLSLLGPGIAPGIELGIERCAELAARCLVRLLELADRLPGTPLPLPPRPLAWLAAAVLALAYGAARRRRRGTRVGLALLGLALLPWTLAPRGLEVAACDVGHGTAVAVRAPGGEVWVFDAGSRDRSGVDRSALGPLLRRWDAGRVTLALSHRHRDHAAGLPWLASRWRPRTWLGAPPIGAPSVQGQVAGTRRLDLGVGRLRIEARDDLVLELGRGSLAPGNEGSRHLAIRWRGRSLLLLGDAVEDGLAEALDRGLCDGPVDLLLLPHHGGRSPHLERLLAASRPRRVWASCTGEAAARVPVVAAGLELATTAVDGPLTLLLRPEEP